MFLAELKERIDYSNVTGDCCSPEYALEVEFVRLMSGTSIHHDTFVIKGYLDRRVLFKCSK